MTDEESREGGKEASKTVIAVIILIGIVGLVVIYQNTKQPSYSCVDKVAGVDVYSRIPLDDVQHLEYITLFDNEGKAAITCNFELSAISTVNRNGFKVFIEEGEEGVYIDRNAAYIRGETDEEILHSCNVFSCMVEGIACPENLWDVEESIVDAGKINVILDINVKGAGLRGYGEFMAALGYIQGRNILVDLNGDGRIDSWEAEENLIQIFPYIKDGDECRLQPISTSLQKLNATNESFKCSELHPSITLINSDTNAIEFDGVDVVVSGDDDHIESACIILRDVISPEFIRSLYRIN